MEKLNPGFLSDEDIRPILDKDIVICGYQERNLTDIGYNLTPTDFIFSTNNKLLIKVHNTDNKKYCWIEPNDTALILTREAVWVSASIAGTFHSKVRVVSKGFGHIGTTLDALWEGPLLIALNNPTKHKLMFVLGEDKGNGFEYSSFVTLIFYRMVTPTNKNHDNPPCRLDVLKDVVKIPKRARILGISKYLKLNRIVDTISDFEQISVNIGQAQNEEERIRRIIDFRQKYQPFAKQIEFHIAQAHEINNKIIRLNKITRGIISGILGIGAIILFATAYFNRNNLNNTSFITLIAAIYMPIAVLFWKGETN